MTEILLRGKEVHGIVATKAEFEAEGTRTDELLRLLEIAHRAGVDIALKVGGCEAIRDLLEARQFGVRYIIAPMVETPYALSKFIAAKDKVFTPEERDSVKFLFNVETISAYLCIDELVSIASAEHACDGIVFGRVDFSGSLGISRDGIESSHVTDVGEDIAATCRDAGLEFVGGAVSIDALASLKRFHGVYLDRFETRKVIFHSSALDSPRLAEALRQAVLFELLWLLNKRDYYGLMYKEDQKRIEMLESRWRVLESG